MGKAQGRTIEESDIVHSPCYLSYTYTANLMDQQHVDTRFCIHGFLAPARERMKARLAVSAPECGSLVWCL